MPPIADTNDVEDDIQIPLYRAFAHTGNVLTLFTAVLDTLHVNTERMAALAGRGFTTATELADTLAREYHLPFRTAHGITARVVQIRPRGGEGSGRGDGGRCAGGSGSDHRPIALPITEEMVRRALDPVAVVTARALPGGPAPDRMRTTIAESQTRLDTDYAWLRRARRAMSNEQ